MSKGNALQSHNVSQLKIVASHFKLFIMKKNMKNIVILFTMACALLMHSCKKDKCTQTVTYKRYEPVYMSYETLRSAVKSEQPRALKNPGKIYVRGSYIFINETDKGIHIINNNNPSSPQNIGFINIPGNIDMAVIGNVLYADSYIDLLTIDISNPQNVVVLKRVENVLPQRIYTVGHFDPAKGVVTAWVEKTITEEIEADCNGNNNWWGPTPFFDAEVMNVSGSGGQASDVSGPRTITPGKGGSMARFAISGFTLYVVDQSSLIVFDISNLTNPVPLGSSYIGRNIETIFPYKNHLFIGSMTGMFIYNINNPLNPSLVASYEHATACDPVVADDNYAYITLRSGTPCNATTDQLEVVNIQNLSSPFLEAAYPMTNPRGLGIDGNLLFICDDGLKVFNVSNIYTISNNQIAHFKNIQAYDVIPLVHKKILLTSGENGFYQYDYSDVEHINLLSSIPVEK
jgi:hypothetical protein